MSIRQRGHSVGLFFVQLSRAILNLPVIDLENAASPSPHAFNARAAVWMKRGLALLNGSSPTSLREAVGYFDQAIELRRSLPLDADPMFRYGFAASWMNRGDALTRLGSREDLRAALISYDAALDVLSPLSVHENPLFARRQAIAWQNRGLTLQAQRDQGMTTDPKPSFEKAIGCLEKAGAVEDRNYLLAVAWTNYANAWTVETSVGAAEQARMAAKQALALAVRGAEESADLSEINLKSRHILCRAIAVLLGQKELAHSAKDELIAEATDAVDDGMALARHWEGRGVRRFQMLAQELFCFGARAYQIYQPHFLGEFALENLDPSQSGGAFATDSRMHAAALESLWRAFRGLQRRNFQRIDTAQFNEFLEELRELSLVEEKLENLRQRYLPVPPPQPHSS